MKIKPNPKIFTDSSVPFVSVLNCGWQLENINKTHCYSKMKTELSSNKLSTLTGDIPGSSGLTKE